MAMLMALNIIEGRWPYSRVHKLMKKDVDAQLAILGFKANEKGEIVPLEEADLVVDGE